MGEKYDAKDWRLYIDSSSKSLKVVILHHGYKFASVPVGHSVKMRETHNSMEALLSALKYKDHE